MPSFETFAALLGFLTSIFLASLMILRLMKLNGESQQRAIFLMDREIYQKNQRIQDLENKLMSPDTRTYQILSATSPKTDQTEILSPLISTSDSFSMSDASEAERTSIMQGIGEEAFDELYIDSINDLGIRHG